LGDTIARWGDVDVRPGTTDRGGSVVRLGHVDARDVPVGLLLAPLLPLSGAWTIFERTAEQEPIGVGR
jgi:hypothetical protein